MGELGQAYEDTNGVFMVGTEKDVRLGINAKISIFNDEEALLTEFVKWIRVIDPGILSNLFIIIFFTTFILIDSMRYFGWV